MAHAQKKPGNKFRCLHKLTQVGSFEGNCRVETERTHTSNMCCKRDAQPLAKQRQMFSPYRLIENVSDLASLYNTQKSEGVPGKASLLMLSKATMGELGDFPATDDDSEVGDLHSLGCNLRPLRQKLVKHLNRSWGTLNAYSAKVGR